MWHVYTANETLSNNTEVGDLDLRPLFLKPFAITFKSLEVELSYFTCTFLAMRPFHSCQKF